MMKRTGSVLRKKAKQLDVATQDLQAGLARGSRRAWLAALGMADDARVRGTEAVRTLADRRLAVKDLSWPAAPEAMERALDTASAAWKSTGDRARVSVERGVATTLNAIGLPGRREVTQLIDRVERLSEQVERLVSEQSAAAKPRRRRTGAKTTRPAAKG